MDKKLFAVAIGSSAGGIDALLEISAAMPPRLPAFVFVTQHIGEHPSILPELMRARGPNPATHPRDGDRPLPGTIYIAPPDHHMLLERDRIRLFRGPRENYCRPAIDPMMRSVALAFRSRAVGVVLSGFLDDGTAGLKAIKQCGGCAIVQDPLTARQPSMPASALANLDVDFSLRIDEIVTAILRVIDGGTRPREQAVLPETLEREQMVHQGRQSMDNLSMIGKPSGLTCPDCGGSLWELNDPQPLRYRCHTGHAFSAQSLDFAQSESAEHSLWAGVRSLQEREILLRRVAMVARAQGDQVQGQAAQAQADHAHDRAKRLVPMIEDEGSGA